MLVQDRFSPQKSSNPNPNLNSNQKPYLRTNDLPSNRFTQTKNLDFSVWVSDNLYKIVSVVLLIVTVAALFFLRNVGDTAALLCFENKARDLEKIEFPRVDWNKITPIADKASRFANFQSDKWIVVSVSDYPCDALKKLVKLKGWQVVAIGDSRTPADWSLKGAIFLSLDEQANLGFRVIDYLPYDSYVRKNVGYLFAMQHGAKKIKNMPGVGPLIRFHATWILGGSMKEST